MEIKAEFAALSEAERGFQQALRQLESALNSLERELDQTLVQWDGDAQKAYTAARMRWDQGSRDLYAELARLHRAIVRAHRNFRSSSDTNVRMWSV